MLSEAELLSTCILLLVAGHETTVNLIAGGTLALLDHPDQLRAVPLRSGLSGSGVEEMLRYVSPVQLTGRALTEDCEFGGVEFAAGDFAMLLLASGNRDPDQFEDPERFDIARNPNNHLGLRVRHPPLPRARRWPGWRPRWPSAPWSGGPPTWRWPSRA